jgi:hypothetical protein
MLASHQEPDGSFGPPASGDVISTGAELVSMGTAYLELGGRLPASTSRRWSAAIARAADFLIPKLNFYINGNINLQETLGMYLAWRVTGDARFYAAYNTSWAFTLQPGPGWPGYGLQYTRVPIKHDGVDGEGYLGEVGTGAPGFDPHYTILQADYAAEMYVLTHQSRALRLLNLLFNQLETRTDLRTLTVSTGGGSRHSAASSGPLQTCALPVLAFADRGRDLLPLAMKQLTQAELNFINFVKSDNDQDQIVGNYVVALMALHPPG